MHKDNKAWLAVSFPYSRMPRAMCKGCSMAWEDPSSCTYRSGSTWMIGWPSTRQRLSNNPILTQIREGTLAYIVCTL